jgi:hypothetical protein
MIIVKLQGGLGNQLFQYALGRHLAQKNGTALKLDISWYGTQTYRSFDLHDWSIIENLATDAEIRSFKKYRRKGRKIWFLYNYLFADESKYVREKGYAFDPKILELGSQAYLDGIWLSEKYFKGIEDIIRKEFRLRAPLPPAQSEIVRKMEKSESVSVCIRRGDFVSDKKISSIHGLLPLDYYERAVEYVADRISNPHFFIFSDDIDWCRSNFKTGYPTTFVSDGHKNISSSQELWLMSSCKHTVNANSSFSWWASWLNQNREKIVIFPKKWFKEESRNAASMVPESWVRLENKFI